MLQPVTGNKQNVLGAFQNAVDAFSDGANPIVDKAMTDAFPDATERSQVRQQLIDNLQQAYQEASTDQTDPKWFAPRGPMAGLAQAAMNKSAQQPDTVAGAAGFMVATEVVSSATGTTATAAAFAVTAAPIEQFGPLDPGWIECLVDGFKTWLKGDAPFVHHKALTDFLYPIAEQITIALVSDWGANNAAAALVSAEIKKANPDIVIHLGDIYYAGQTHEATEMLKLWPKTIAPQNSFALNGNHEMFGGGHAYFETVLKNFGQTASYFGLRNTHWQILAFDSAYIEQRLVAPAENETVGNQWTWLLDKMKNSVLSTILLSHHQPLSAFADENGAAFNLRKDYSNFTKAAGQGVFGWFFGHEHRCTIYNDLNIPYFARLIGNGCIPHTAPPKNQKPEKGCFSFEAMNFASNNKGDAMSGFALLKFNGPNLAINYINEDGSSFYNENWAAKPVSLKP